MPYARFNVADFRTSKIRLHEAYETVFGIVENAKRVNQGYQKSKITPLVQILWQKGLSTFHPRLVTKLDNEIYLNEICLLHALFTGDTLYSFAHLMLDDIWDMYEHDYRRNIPHGYYISEMLKRLGAVSEKEYVEVIPPEHRLLTRSSFSDLKFSESDTEYIIDDRVTLQRVTFPKFAQPSQMHVPSPSPHLDMNRLLTSFQKQQSEMMTMVTSLQKQQSEMITNIQKQMERQALDAERREQERERQADMRAHAIIWDIERQRYYYEQEQEQLHKAWNKAYGSEEFQFPQIFHTSFHPPQVGSPYYDPTQGNEIPKAFQDLFHDIYSGTRR